MSSELILRDWNEGLKMPGFVAPLTSEFEKILAGGMLVERGGQIRLTTVARKGLEPVVIGLRPDGEGGLVGQLTYMDLILRVRRRVGVMIPSSRWRQKVLAMGERLCDELENEFAREGTGGELVRQVKSWQPNRGFGQAYDEIATNPGGLVVLGPSKGSKEYWEYLGLRRTGVGETLYEVAVRMTALRERAEVVSVAKVAHLSEGRR